VLWIDELRAVPLFANVLQGFAPEFARRWNRFARQSGESWSVDETYIKIRGVWVYLYRAVDREGRTVDFRLSRRRDVMAAKLFFRKALKTQGCPPRVFTLDGYAASHRAVRIARRERGLERYRAEVFKISQQHD
jgi:transposase-like protein